MRSRLVLLLIAAGMICSSASGGGATVSSPRPDVTRLAIHTPQPDYPSEALAHRISGSGVFLLRVHIPSGRVTQVLVGASTGNRVLDAAAVKVFLQWRFKPGAVPYREITRPRLSPPQT